MRIFTQVVRVMFLIFRLKLAVSKWLSRLIVSVVIVAAADANDLVLPASGISHGEQLTLLQFWLDLRLCVVIVVIVVIVIGSACGRHVIDVVVAVEPIAAPPVRLHIGIGISIVVVINGQIPPLLLLTFLLQAIRSIIYNNWRTGPHGLHRSRISPSIGQWCVRIATPKRLLGLLLIKANKLTVIGR